MFHDVVKSVMDVVGACQGIQEFTQGHTLESYQADYMRRCAVERLFLIVGEAFCRIDDADPLFRQKIPEMGDIIGMRNRVVHGYDYVDDEIVWTAVEKRIPDLLEKLTEWLKNEGVFL